MAPLPAGTFYRHDLVGCEVATRPDAVDRRGDGGRRARWNAASLIVKGAHGDVLIPLVAEICVTVIADRAADRRERRRTGCSR